MNSNEKNKTYDDEGSEEGVVDGDQDVLVVGLDDVDDLFEVGDAKQRIGADFQPNLFRRSVLEAEIILFCLTKWTTLMNRFAHNDHD